MDPPASPPAGAGASGEVVPNMANRVGHAPVHFESNRAVQIRLRKVAAISVSSLTLVQAIGIPTYGAPGGWGDPDGNGAHALNERRSERSVFVGRDFLTDLVKNLRRL